MPADSFLDFEPDPKKIRALKFFLLATLVVGALASALAKPLPIPIASWATQPLWTLSYGLMAVAAWLAWKPEGWKNTVLVFFCAQLALNLIWRILPLTALAIALNICVFATLILFARRNLLAALTFFPCMAWNLFVTVPIGF